MDMVERVAKAIYEGRNGPGCVAWAHRDKGYRAPYLADAHNALRAMREPTPEMERVGAEELMSLSGWQAMIDAALHPIQNREGE